ncbi:hypothetical protein ANCDUO_07538 [Ancylostoma duodenale]|uniref:OBG-type G domain-containing protein n=1 Tax=Ancylostoma duodenale TaxID=51022 RepID=A0A0C2GLS7_9BILA|nr:hypothetical protein ANCDUO_07538 [Ancylostoma duodenale]
MHGLPLKISDLLWSLRLRNVQIRQQISDCKASRGAAGGSDTPCVFVLNKADLPEHRWQTTEKEVGEQIEHLTGSQDSFVVCSAANNLNIDKASLQLFIEA